MKNKEPRTYGNGLSLRKENLKYCAEQVWKGFYSYQCTRKRVIGEYCKQHAKK